MTEKPIELDARRSVAAQRAVETHRRWKLENPRVMHFRRLDLEPPAAGAAAQDQARRELTMDILDDVGDFPCEMPDAPWLPRSSGTRATLRVLSRWTAPFRV